MLPSTKQYLCDCGETKDYRVTKNCHYMSIQRNTNVISSSERLKKKIYESLNCDGDCKTTQKQLLTFYGNMPKTVNNIHFNQ